jgi:hypothetical protein
MSPPHESVFTYNIGRPYPFKWFTPVVIAGFVIATVLFSFLNFVSNGYDLIVQTSSDPNQTISDGVWFENWPSYLTSKVKPSCQPADINVNTLLFTNQTALTYTLVDVWQEHADGVNQSVLPSLTYFNNVIEECVVTSIDMDIESLDRSASQYAYSQFGASVRAYVTCNINSAAGQTRLNLTTTYDYVPSTVDFSMIDRFLGTDFLNRDSQRKASLYWGESLMSTYWAYMTRSMQDLGPFEKSFGKAPIRKGTISFMPNRDAATDITDLSFFEIGYQFVVDYGLGQTYIIFAGEYNNTSSVSDLNAANAYPNIWIQGDSLAKSTYSTILTDLGQISSKTNILADAKLLQYFTSNFSLALEHIANAIPGPATQDYDTLKANTGPLGTTPSVISTKYICQVPHLKSGGNIFVAVLIADLVFLQAVWKIFTLSTGFFLLRKRPSINHCEGCVGHRTGHQKWPRDSSDGDFESRAGGYQSIGLNSVRTSKRVPYQRHSSQQELLLE